jgi:hypothetical protein
MLYYAYYIHINLPIESLYLLKNQRQIPLDRQREATLFYTVLSFSYPYSTKWGWYNMFFLMLCKDSAIIFTTGRLPDANPSWNTLFYTML